MDVGIQAQEPTVDKPFWTRARRALWRYIRNIFVGVDQLANAMAGGDPDWTISAWLGHCVKASPCRSCKWVCVNVCALLDLVDRRHCHSSLEADPSEGANDVWNILLGPMSRWGWVLRLGALAVLLLLSAGIVFAQDWSPRFPPWMPQHASGEQHWYDGDCCSMNDCRPIMPGEVVQAERNGQLGYLVAPTGEFFPFTNTKVLRPSLDPQGGMHRCVNPWSSYDKATRYIRDDATTRCLYVPAPGG